MIGVVAAGLLVRSDLPALQAQAAAGDKQLQALREQVRTLGERIAGYRSDPRLAEELALAQQLATVHDKVLQTLRQRFTAPPPPLAEPLRGLARQAMAGLWLTGFAWDADNDAIEIRGRTTDPALLPEYMRWLEREAAFHGRAFAALQLNEGKAVPLPVKGGKSEATLPAYHEFTLVPVRPDSAAPATKP